MENEMRARRSTREQQEGLSRPLGLDPELGVTKVDVPSRRVRDGGGPGFSS